jgi:DNA-binding GntR family transcriptional regulator
MSFSENSHFGATVQIVDNLKCFVHNLVAAIGRNARLVRCSEDEDLRDLARATSPTNPAGEIFSSLRAEILSGRMKAGQRLTEAELTSRFGVGRGVVREVLHQLSHQGLLAKRPNCGAVVAPEAPKRVRSLIVPIRRIIEVYALRMVFEDLDDTEFRRWDEVLEQMHDACVRQDVHAVAEADIAFHRYLLERAGQPDLIVIWETLVGRIRSHFRRTHRRYPDIMKVYDEHRQLAEAFRSGDETTAERLLKENIA